MLMMNFTVPTLSRSLSLHDELTADKTRYPALSGEDPEVLKSVLNLCFVSRLNQDVVCEKNAEEGLQMK